MFKRNIQRAFETKMPSILPLLSSVLSIDLRLHRIGEQKDNRHLLVFGDFPVIDFPLLAIRQLPSVLGGQGTQQLAERFP